MEAMNKKFNRDVNSDMLPSFKGYSFFTGENETVYKDQINVLIIRRVVGIIWFFVPILIFILGPVFVVGKSDGACVPWRPDVAVYGIGWGFLVLCLMFSWLIVSRRSTGNIAWASQVVLFFLVILLCIFWMWLYHEDKRNGISVFVFLIMILLILLPIVQRTNTYAFALLLPLSFWAIFQLGVNCAEMICL